MACFSVFTLFVGYRFVFAEEFDMSFIYGLILLNDLIIYKYYSVLFLFLFGWLN